MGGHLGSGAEQGHEEAWGDTFTILTVATASAVGMHGVVCVLSHSVVSDSLRPHGL